MPRRPGQVPARGQSQRAWKREQCSGRRASPHSATAPRGIRLRCDTSLSWAPVAYEISCLFGGCEPDVPRICRNEARCFPGVSQNSEMPPRAGANWARSPFALTPPRRLAGRRPLRGVEGGQVPTPNTSHRARWREASRHSATTSGTIALRCDRSGDVATTQDGRKCFFLSQAAGTRRGVATKADASSRCRTGARCLKSPPRPGAVGVLGTWSRCRAPAQAQPSPLTPPCADSSSPEPAEPLLL